MDYRKPVVFGENWSPSRYKVLPYFAAEKKLLQQESSRRILDLGCAAGWNMSRFVQYGRKPMGLDVVPERVTHARRHGPVMVASGLELPVASNSLDVIYIQHVLHHIGDVDQALKEVHRCLKPGGMLFLVETVEDSPLIHWGRRVSSNWLGDEINAPFHYDELQAQLRAAGFELQQKGQYSVVFWVWEILPDHYPFLEKLTPVFVGIEQVMVRFLRRFSAHCYLVAQRVESPV